MALGDKYILERNADAAIVQKGTESEKKALRARLE